jgi:hypothetical protein
VLAHKASSRLANVEFIFPSIEMRYGIGTVKGYAINVHLLVNTADPSHVTEITCFLRGSHSKRIKTHSISIETT